MKTKLIQLLLAALAEKIGRKEMDPVYIDGILGPKTNAAVDAFWAAFGSPSDNGLSDEVIINAISHALCYGLPEAEGAGDDVSPAEPDQNDAQVLDTGYPYFALSEFRCKCADPSCIGKSMRPTDALLRKLVDIRARFGQPVTISSGIRCPAHNAAVGGVSNSYHLSGRAADISVRGYTADQVAAYCSGLQLHYYYKIDSSYVHVDI